MSTTQKITRRVYVNGILDESLSAKKPSDLKRMRTFWKQVGNNFYMSARPLPKVKQG